jgi:hypothetical protein
LNAQFNALCRLAPSAVASSIARRAHSALVPIAFSITGKVEPEPTIRVDLSFENVDAFENPRPYVASIYDFFVALDWSEKDLDSCMLTKSPEPGKAVTVRNSKQGTMLSCSFGKGYVSYLLHLQLEPDFTR